MILCLFLYNQKPLVNYKFYFWLSECRESIRASLKRQGREDRVAQAANTRGPDRKRNDKEGKMGWLRQPAPEDCIAEKRTALFLIETVLIKTDLYKQGNNGGLQNFKASVNHDWQHPLWHGVRRGVVSQVVWVSSEPCLKLMPVPEWGKNTSPQGGNSAGQGEEGSGGQHCGFLFSINCTERKQDKLVGHSDCFILVYVLPACCRRPREALARH